MATLTALPNSPTAKHDAACLRKLVRAVRSQRERVKSLGRFHDLVATELEGTLQSVAKLEQQQVLLRATVLAKCVELRQRLQADPEEPAVKLAGTAAELQAAGFPGPAPLQPTLPATEAATPDPRQELPVQRRTSEEMILTPHLPLSSQGMPLYLHRRLLPLHYSLPVASQRRVTTLLIRPVPRGCLQEDLAAFWSPYCASSPYDMLYAPHRKTRGTGESRKPKGGLHGYVFINFVSADAAARFRAAWQGRIPEESHLLPGQAWTAPLEISEANAQGFDENMRSFIEKDLDRLDRGFWPVVLVDSRRRSFADVARGFRP